MFIAAGVPMLRFDPEAQLTAQRFGVNVSGYRLAGAAQLAGAAGLAVGFGFPWWGVTAAGCLVALMLGALTAHAHVGDPWRDRIPACIAIVLAIAAGALLLCR